MSLYWSVFTFSILAVLLQAVLAYRDYFFSVAQMQLCHADRGVPFDMHTGMWGDLFIITPLMALVVSKYAHFWDNTAMLWAVGAGVVLSLIMHCTYISAGNKFPEAHTHDGDLTAAGMVHLIYMGLAFAVIALFFFATPHPAAGDVRLVYALLMVHVVLGVHVPLKLLAPEWFPYHGIWDWGTFAPIFGSAAALGIMSYWALH